MTGPYQIPRRILVALITLAALGGCLDYTIGAIPVKTLHIPQIQSLIICLVVAGMIAADREGNRYRRPGRAAAGWRFEFGIGLLVFGVIGAMALHEWIHRLKMREAIAAVYLTGAAFWFAAPMLTRARLDGTGRGRWLPLGMGALIVYLTICLITAIAGPRPQYSIAVYTMERALPVALIAGWARAAERDEKFLRGSGVAVLTILGALMLISFALNAIDLVGTDSVRAALVRWKLVFAKAESATWDIPRRRILFPMLHFNRTAYWAMIVTMLMLVAARARNGRPTRLRIPALVMAAVGFWLVTQTYTRGVAVAAFAGIFVWVATISRRMPIAGVVLALVAAIAVPTTFTRQMKTVLDPQTYWVNQPPLTSMKTRLMAWGWSLKSIQEHPLAGLGYGLENIERAYRIYVDTEGSAAAKQSLSGKDEMRHVHNLWLETMAESGIAAGLALLAFCIVRWAALVAVWRRGAGRDRGQAGAWLAMEVALLIAGMIFYMLKQNSGMLTLFVWAYATVWAAAALDRSSSCSEIRAVPTQM